MIKRYNQYIKEHLDIDPFGEEDWEDEDPSIFKIVQKQGLPFDQITELNCGRKNLTSLEGVEKLTNLEELTCYENHLISLEGIWNLTNLKEIYCGNNELTSLEGIENLTELKILCCHSNQLENLEGIEKLVNLKVLWYHNNPFSKEYKEYIKDYCKKRNIDLWI